ncbi:hypothetical protein ACRRTK_007472 [Alexandromys fortis]
MEQRTAELLRENQELKENCASLHQQNTDVQAELGKVEEMEQRTEELLRENQELKEHCASLCQQKSDAKAELQREQAQLAQQNKELIVENQATSNTMQHQRSKIGELLQRLALQQKKVQELERRIEKVLRENQQLKYRCASLPKQNSDEEKEPKSKLDKTEEAKKRTVKKLSMACSLSAWLCGWVSVFRRWKGIVRH